VRVELAKLIIGTSRDCARIAIHPETIHLAEKPHSSRVFEAEFSEANAESVGQAAQQF
jgi:hypothetical protein